MDGELTDGIDLDGLELVTEVVMDRRYSVVSSRKTITDLECWRALLRYSEELEAGVDWAEVWLDGSHVVDRYRREGK